MRKLTLITASLALAAGLANPAQATVLVAGTTLVPTSAVPAGTQGTLLASQSTSGTAFTFAATFNQAVYRNTLGTLDFYYQVLRTGAGTISSNEIRSFTVSDFGTYLVDAFAMGTDPDGAGLFVAAANPNLANGTPSPSTTTFGRSPTGNVLTTEFGANGLTGTENSATYIFRTNAISFNTTGTFGIIDGSTVQGLTYQPIGAAVPEPATWAMMLVGFGAVGFGMRRRRKIAVRFQAA